MPPEEGPQSLELRHFTMIVMTGPNLNSKG